MNASKVISATVKLPLSPGFAAWYAITFTTPLSASGFIVVLSNAPSSVLFTDRRVGSKVMLRSSDPTSTPPSTGVQIDHY